MLLPSPAQRVWFNNFLYGRVSLMSNSDLNYFSITDIFTMLLLSDSVSTYKVGVIPILQTTAKQVFL